MSVYIAKCPVHGLHGEREECFVCGESVEQVEMVLASELTEAHLSLCRIHTWLGNVIEARQRHGDSADADKWFGLIEDAYNEAAERVEIK